MKGSKVCVFSVYLELTTFLSFTVEKQQFLYFSLKAMHVFLFVGGC